MARFATGTEITNSANSVLVQKGLADGNADAIKQMRGSDADGSLTITTGGITPVVSVNTVDTEASASTDELSNIDATNFPDGFRIHLKLANIGRVVTVEHEAGGSGQITLLGVANRDLSTTTLISLRSDGTDWIEEERNINQSYGRTLLGLGTSAVLDVTEGTGDVLRESLPITLDTDKTAVGIKTTAITGGSSTFLFGGCAHPVSSDRLYVCSTDSLARMPAVALALNEPIAGGLGEFLLYGVVRDDSWSWTEGLPIYVGSAINTLTQSPVGGRDAIQQVGVALSATHMLFDPQQATGVYSNVITKTIDTGWDGTSTIVTTRFRPTIVTVYAVRENDATFSAESTGKADITGLNQNTSLLYNGFYDFDSVSCFVLSQASGISVRADITMNDDGFTFNWEHTGSGSGTARIMYTAWK